MVRNLLPPSCPPVDSLIGYFGAVRRGQDLGHAATAFARLAVFLCAISLAGVLCACGGEEGSSASDNTQLDSASDATGTLNDTGIDWCTENITTPSTWVNNAVCSAVNWAGNLWGQQQDAFWGRDALASAGTLTKVGGGMAGFDFTKIGAVGKALTMQGGTWSDSGSEAAGSQWDCVRDNVTGLVWEVKRNDATHLRHMDHTYTWYNSDITANDGSAGAETSSTCTGVADTDKCNTQSYVTAVNAAGLCGKKDWRLPTVDELSNLTHMGRTNPVVDTNYFPNTTTFYYWSSSTYASTTIAAWDISFYYGYDNSHYKDKANHVRLVRSGQ